MTVKGKKILVLGVANERSLAWGVCQKVKQQGGRLAMTYLNESMERRVRPLAEKVEAELIEPADVTRPEELDALFEKVKNEWGTLDGVVHSLAFANKEDLAGRFIETSRQGFQTALDISAYSLIDLARRAEPLMKEQGGSIVTMTYLGAERVIPNYNLMGVAKAALEASVRYLAYDLGLDKIRVNGISAGPVKTLAASGVKDLRKMLSAAAEATPLKEGIDQDDVGEMGAFLLGDGSRRITGTTHYVDSGAHIMARRSRLFAILHFWFRFGVVSPAGSAYTKSIRGQPTSLPPHPGCR
jgi:enoyl-[acyl-carrier protein] reductase I